MTHRRSARVLLLDPAQRILLLRCVVPRTSGDFVFWLTPGGEIEAGETPHAAAARELEEELGLNLPLTGPVAHEHNHFEHGGQWRANEDFFFLARCQADQPRLLGVTEAERALMQELRWWSAAELAHSSERIFPAWLSQRLPALAAMPSVC